MAARAGSFLGRPASMAAMMAASPGALACRKAPGAGTTSMPDSRCRTGPIWAATSAPAPLPAQAMRGMPAALARAASARRSGTVSGASVRSRMSGPLPSMLMTAEPSRRSPSSPRSVSASAGSSATSAGQQHMAFPHRHQGGGAALVEADLHAAIGQAFQAEIGALAAGGRRCHHGGDRRIREAGAGQRLDQPGALPRRIGRIRPVLQHAAAAGGEMRAGGRLAVRAFQQPGFGLGQPGIAALAGEPGAQPFAGQGLRQEDKSSSLRAIRHAGDAIAGRAHRFDRQFQGVSHHGPGAGGWRRGGPRPGTGSAHRPWRAWRRSAGPPAARQPSGRGRSRRRR